MLKKLVPVGFLFIFLTATSAFANILFEGWFQVIAGSEQIGYLVERYEFVNNQFKCVYYIKTNADGNNVTESLTAYSKSDLTPLNYEYTSTVGDSVKTIKADFKADVMTTEVFDGKKKTKSSTRIKKGTFLSQFLLYLILQQKDGLKVGKSYTYSAIAEEDGEVYTGSAFIKSMEPVKGKDAFKILNEFKGEKFFTWVSTHGEPLLVRSPEKNIDVRFAANQEEATKGMGVNLEHLHLLFGHVPGEAGGAVEATPVSTDKASAAPGKKSGKTTKKKKKHAANPGEGVEIKGVPPPKTGTAD